MSLLYSCCVYLVLLFPLNCTATEACALNLNHCMQASSSTGVQLDFGFVQPIVHTSFVAEADASFVAGYLDTSNQSSDFPKLYLLGEVKVYKHDRKAEWYLRGEVCSVRLLLI